MLHVVAILFPPDPAPSLFSLERSFILIGTLAQYLLLLSHGWYICNVTPAETFSNQHQSFQTAQDWSLNELVKELHREAAWTPFFLTSENLAPGCLQMIVLMLEVANAGNSEKAVG